MAAQHEKMKGERSGGDVPSKVAPAAPARYRPDPLATAFGWEPFRWMRDEFDRFFEQSFGGWPVSREMAGRDLRLALDVDETEDNLMIRAEAPGFEPNDFDLQVRGGQLVVHATHKAETEEEKRGYHEWRRQEFYRSVPIPSEIDAEHVQAMYRNGVLTVTLPKTDSGKGRHITVQG
jgi:HSP20 family protein